MATIAQPSTARNTTSHHATYRGIACTARLLTGGYAISVEGYAGAKLVSYRDTELVLLGRCDLADAQRQADDAAGGLAAIVCGRGR